MTDMAPKFEHGFPASPQQHNVVVLGASPKPARYSNRAQRMLMEQGYQVIPVHPKIKEIEGVAVAHNLRAIKGPAHTLTLYLGADRSFPMIDDIIRLNPRRVIFNPGSESADLEQRLHEHQVPIVHGCTLVMLRTNQF